MLVRVLLEQYVLAGASGRCSRGETSLPIFPQSLWRPASYRRDFKTTTLGRWLHWFDASSTTQLSSGMNSNLHSITNSSILSNQCRYEIINEPPPGTDLWPWYARCDSAIKDNPCLFCRDFAANLMFPFYKRVIEALTGVRDGLPTCPATAPTGANCSYPGITLYTTEPCCNE